MTLHIVGAGLAGLSCALTAADSGVAVVLHEATGHAGGRCRSWVEPTLGRLIDNGTHMVVGANHAVFGYLRRIGSIDGLRPGPATFPMVDLQDRSLWTANPAKLAPSILSSLWRMRRCEDASVADCLGGSRNFRRFWDPLALAIMNTPAEAASASVFRRVLARTLWRGQKASQPYLARIGLSETFVDPALTTLASLGVVPRLLHPLQRLILDGTRATGLVFEDEEIALGPDDSVVLAVPWPVARHFLPTLPEFPASPIVNAHFRLESPPHLGDHGLLGLLGGVGDWLFLRGDVLSVTVSAASELAERSVGDVAETLWAEAAAALGLTGKPAATRVIKEKRATLFHTPGVETKRPPARAGDNLLLAGDWTATGLPCTLEGSIWSGAHAARLSINRFK